MKVKHTRTYPLQIVHTTSVWHDSALVLANVLYLIEHQFTCTVSVLPWISVRISRPNRLTHFSCNSSDLNLCTPRRRIILLTYSSQRFFVYPGMHLTSIAYCRFHCLLYSNIHDNNVIAAHMPGKEVHCWWKKPQKNIVNLYNYLEIIRLQYLRSGYKRCDVSYNINLRVPIFYLRMVIGKYIPKT